VRARLARRYKFRRVPPSSSSLASRSTRTKARVFLRFERTRPNERKSSVHHSHILIIGAGKEWSINRKMRLVNIEIRFETL
jgi:hypothetical protein